MFLVTPEHFLLCQCCAKSLLEPSIFELGWGCRLSNNQWGLVGGIWQHEAQDCNQMQRPECQTWAELQGNKNKRECPDQESVFGLSILVYCRNTAVCSVCRLMWLLFFRLLLSYYTCNRKHTDSYHKMLHNVHVKHIYKHTTCKHTLH